jgi:hypothetical protein
VSACSKQEGAFWTRACSILQPRPFSLALLGSSDNGSEDDFSTEDDDEGCSTVALSGATAADRFDAALYLHANHSEECTLSTILCAYQLGSLESLRWLAYNFPDKYDRSSLLVLSEVRKLFLQRWGRNEGFRFRG